MSDIETEYLLNHIFKLMAKGVGVIKEKITAEEIFKSAERWREVERLARLGAAVEAMPDRHGLEVDRQRPIPRWRVYLDASGGDVRATGATPQEALDKAREAM